MKIKNIKKLEGEYETVDIEVENTHSYQLENGAVSHNTLSLLAGATPGVHPAYSKHYIRRVRMSSSDGLVKLCRDAKYKVEYAVKFDGTEDRSTVVVEFPCTSGENTIVAKEMTAIQQLELVKKLQTEWADNSVSVTVYYKREELPEIKNWLKDKYETSVKTVSFLLHSEHGFAQAPYEEISEEQYNALVKKVVPIVHIQINGSDIQTDECASGACPIK